jgi:hypothetical protein
MDTQTIVPKFQDPRKILAAFGAHALLGLYIKIWWDSLALGEKLIANYDIVTAAEYQNCENWLGIAAEILPEWATDILADIDAALEGDGL